MSEPAREPIRCDCHGTAVMAIKRGEKIIIRQLKHGEEHYVSVVVDKPAQPVHDST